MSPIGPQHERIVDLLNEWSFENLPRRQVWIRIQQSVGIPGLDSVPEPDLAWVIRRHYEVRPQPEDIQLIVEVADSSLEYDRGEKANLYAAAGIKDYWIVNVAAECVEVYREPEGGRYRKRETVQAPAEARPLSFPKLALPVSLLFPPRTPGMPGG
jgi:Uma2 family endonuclease